MKYAVIVLQLLYLLALLTAGIVLLLRRRGGTGAVMAIAVLVFALSDGLLLAPRILDVLLEEELTLWLGLGRLGAELTATVCYIIMYLLWERVYPRDARDRVGLTLVWGFALLRLLLCFLPQNEWRENLQFPLWWTVRTVPFAVLGAAVTAAWRSSAEAAKTLRPVWILLLIDVAGIILTGAAPQNAAVFPALLVPGMLARLGLAACFLRHTK